MNYVHLHTNIAQAAFMPLDVFYEVSLHSTFLCILYIHILTHAQVIVPLLEMSTTALIGIR